MLRFFSSDMELMNRSFSRCALLAATLLVAGVIISGPASEVRANDIDDASSILPPLPDIRTPDQVRWFERWRNRRVNQMKIRHAKADARREAKEQKATVSRPAQDPSTASAVVQSQAGAPYAGSNAAPETIDGAALKPFDAGSKFYQGGFLVFQGKDGRRR